MKKRSIMTKSLRRVFAAAMLSALLTAMAGVTMGNTHVLAATGEDLLDSLPENGEAKIGGGYAASGQLKDVGFATVIYDATNGLPTSDANCLYSADDGYIWVGGYSGILKYDGESFNRLDSSGGLTNGKVFFEDSDHRMWIGTNDNGVVVVGGQENIRITYEDGLPSSSIRGFGESKDGTMWIGTTNGVVYLDENYKAHPLEDERLENQYINRLSTDSEGKIYGNTRSGDAFCIFAGKVTEFVKGSEMGIGEITTIYADPNHPGYVYIGCSGKKIYHGPFGKNISRYNEIPVNPLAGIVWINSCAGRIWLSSGYSIGYLDENNVFHLIDGIPFDNSIEMIIDDYQGNIWITSSRQGVMKIVSSNFKNLTYIANQQEEVVNTTCLRDGLLYIGTDNGLQIIDSTGKSVTNELTKYMGDTRIRCIVKDKKDYLWICCYDNKMGLISVSPKGVIKSYTEGVGLISNEVRCAKVAEDGSVIVGTNKGISIIKDGRVSRNYGENEGLENIVILSVEDGEDGAFYAATDGDGIYEINRKEIKKIGREEGLTSEVILRIKYDPKMEVYWLVTSNSIEYMKNGKIVNVESFPYNNNFDIFDDDNHNLWVLSSYGVFCVRAQDMLGDKVKDYRLSTVENGLPSVPTANSFSEMNDAGTIYISGRSGVASVNVNNFFDQSSTIKIGIRSVQSNGETVYPNADGEYVLPAVFGRVQISPAILDYTMTNPTVHMYLEGNEDSGITATQNKLSALEYTRLKYGNYKLHIQIIDPSNGNVNQEEVFKIIKKPHFLELTIVRILMVLAALLIVGVFVWRFMSGTVIRRQYEQIRAAKDEAERANLAKSRFLANISHELRTPINTIVGMDEMIMREDPTDVPKPYFLAMINYAYDIKSATEALMNLINDLLDMSKIESGKMHLVETEYDTIELLRSVVTMIRVRSSQKDLTFEVKIDEELPKKLYGDSGKIKQIILNLLTNAVKYTDEGGFVLKVSIAEMTEEECSLRISVKDTGIGVKPEDVDKLFTAYERLDEEKNSAIQGTGLGLDISRRFAELMNGHLWCESVYGVGSEFILTLSQKIIDKSGIGKFIEHEDKAVKGPYVPKFIAPDAEVLVVDDNPMNLNVIKNLLKATRMFITTAASGEECLEKIKYGSFNIVLLDHMMPGMDGIETLQEIRKTHPDLPVYALTANAAAGGEAFYRSKGFNGYLAKPVDSEELEKAIMKHLPAEIMMEPVSAMPEEAQVFPKDKEWLNDVEGISSLYGIKNSGGITAFINAITLFYDTIDGNSEVIEKAYNVGDIRLYTVKVHALKSSCRIVGAMELSALAEQLEDAGNKENMDFINANTGKLLADYRAFKEKLAGLGTSTVTDDDSDKEPIPDDELMEAYEALKELVPQMDYDAVEMVIGELKAYRLKDEDAEKIAKLEKLLKTFSWDEMEKVLG